jgi:hypothetical protein
LQTKGVNTTYFHGALDPYKKANFDAWCEGRALVMCATVAFGMGINKANVRFVVHLSIPQSIEYLDFPKSAVRGSWKRQTFVTSKRAKFTGAFLLR